MANLNFNYSFNSSSLSHNNDDITLIENINNINIPFNFSDSIHFHDYTMFLFCSDGNMSICHNSSNLSINKADVLCCEPNSTLVIYDISPSFNGSILWISTKCLIRILLSDDALLRKGFIMMNTPVHHIGDYNVQLFKDYFCLLKTRLSSHPVIDKVSNHFIILAIINDIVSCNPVQSFSVSINKSGINQSNAIFRNFLWLLCSEPKKARPVSYYANKLNISSKHLSLIVKSNCGVSTHKCITSFLIRHIKNLLADPQISIKEIAFSLDFSSMTFFSKFVRANIGMSPSEYRQMCLNSI